MKVLIILQNAWCRGAAPGETQFIPGMDPADSHRVWERALWRSHTGTRLQSMLPEGCTVVVANASPFVGSRAGERFVIDLEHVRSQARASGADLVVLLGAEAAKARTWLEVLGYDVITGPHPASRRLSRDMADEVRVAILRVALERGCR